MLVVIRSKKRAKHRGLSFEGNFINQLCPVQKGSTFRLCKPFASFLSALLLIVTLSDYRYRIQFVSLLCIAGILAFVSSYLHSHFACCIREKVEELSGVICVKLGNLRSTLSIWASAIGRMEHEFLKLSNVVCTVNQIVFFVICEKVLVPQQNVTALYSLMFYNVIGYGVLYIKQMINKHSFHLYVNVASHSKVPHLAMSATKIVLEWTKAIAFITTIGFFLFIVCLENKLRHFQPTAYYTVCTWIYYICTEKIFVEFFPRILSLFHISELDDLESLWAPVLLTLLTELLSLIFACLSLLYGTYHTAILTLYVNVYLTHKLLVKDSLQTLHKERSVIVQFRPAMKEELKEFDDVCAVCLNIMHTARVTPCHHMFHTDCLRKCLQSSNICPLCKREFSFCYS